jgi:hypothetical protein
LGLARIVAFFFCRIRIFHALAIYNQKTGGCAPTIASSHLSNHIFLMLLPINYLAQEMTYASIGNPKGDEVKLRVTYLPRRVV